MMARPCTFAAPLSLSLLLSCSASTHAPSIGDINGPSDDDSGPPQIEDDAGLNPIIPSGPTSHDASASYDFDASCGGESHQGEASPVDMYVMIDTSSSMTELTLNGTSKWDAVRTALANFFGDPKSKSLGVGIQYFPQHNASVPATCTSSSACGQAGPCILRTCSGAGNQIEPCDTDADCASVGGSCVDLGSCALSGGFCAPAGSSCLGAQDTCDRLQTSICQNRDSCDANVYGQPAVAIAPLATASGALVASINQQRPDGNTPTGPAIQGAVDQASAYAKANPEHKVVVVLVTDGLPTECSPTNIDAVAQIVARASFGTPKIATFVVGVFAQGGDEGATSPKNLDKLASAGGSGQAILIDTAHDVTKSLQDALDKIRGNALACEFKIPPPRSGDQDYGKVNMTFTPGSGGRTVVGFVKGQEACDPTRGGWYYDQDPAHGNPTRIVVCDATCKMFGADPAGKVDVLLGCASDPLIPR